jgi:hypothetical protein
MGLAARSRRGRYRSQGCLRCATVGLSHAFLTVHQPGFLASRPPPGGTVNDERHTASLLVFRTARADRRSILGVLAALPAILGFLVFGPDPSDAKQGPGKSKGKGRGKGQGKKKNRGNKGAGGGGYSPDGEERAFLDLINTYRRQHGAGNLALQNQLGAAADHHSQDMADKNYFSHKLSNGDSAEENIARFGYTNWKYVGENIAAGFESANKAMDAWKSSPEHDQNMRNGHFTEIGIGRAYNGNAKYGWYWTTTFGSR